jgi:hypothetical protein
MKTNKTEHSRWQQFLSSLAMIAAVSLTALGLSGCPSSSSDSPPPPATVAAPGAPTAFSVTGGENVATLQWSPPASSVSVGVPVSYEIYRSTTSAPAATIVNPTNFVTTTPVVDGQTVYTFTNTALPGATTYYFVVTAKNAGGETPSTVASDQVTGPPTPATYGNNFSAALIFADDIGITNLPLDPLKSWAAGTADVRAIDYNTGLRPLATEVTAMLALLPTPQTTLPYLPVPSKIDKTYFEQKSINTWQGQWAAASGVQDVSAKWGDNMTSASLKASSKIRIEMVLTKDVTATPMTAYTMKLLSGSGTNELQGTNNVTYNPTTAFVFATNAHLVIQKFNGAALDAPLVDQALFDPSVPDGLNKLSGEIPVSGNFTYGFVWQPSTSGSTAGKYRVTFKLDPKSEFGTGNPANNTFIKAATNGGLVSDTEVFIDINVK